MAKGTKLVLASCRDSLKKITMSFLYVSKKLSNEENTEMQVSYKFMKQIKWYMYTVSMKKVSKFSLYFDLKETNILKTGCLIPCK